MKTIKSALTRAVAAVASVAVLLCAFSAQSFAASEKTPEVSAKSAVLIEAESGSIIYEKNSDEKLPMASTTKIMTALVALEHGDMEKNVEVKEDAVGIEGSSIYLRCGEVILMRDLVYGLMLESANDAAAAIAYEISGGIEPFACLMNEMADKLGLENTHFTNPHGLDDEDHYTTASDLARLTAAALKNEEFRTIVSTYKKTIPLNGDEGTRLLLNHNKLLRTYDNAIGVKTGFTKRSGRCLVSAAEQDGVTMIAVTLNAPNDWDDHKKMLDFGFSKYGRVVAAEEGSVFVDLPCIGGDKSSVRCSNTETLALSVPKGARVVTRIEADRYFPAPVKAGDALAKAVFYVDGEVVGSLPLYAEHDVLCSNDEPSLLERILHFLGR